LGRKIGIGNLSAKSHRKSRIFKVGCSASKAKVEAAGIEPDCVTIFGECAYGDPTEGTGAKSVALCGKSVDLPLQLAAI
jgi:hypothetical protein